MSKKNYKIDKIKKVIQNGKLEGVDEIIEACRLSPLNPGSVSRVDHKPADNAFDAAKSISEILKGLGDSRKQELAVRLAQVTMEMS